MEICKNVRSNRYFIYIGDTGNGEALLINPEAEIKSLKLDLFHEVEEQDETYLLENNIVTESQVKRFHDYNNSRVEEFIENFKEMSPYEQKIVLKRMQEMVENT
jgi:hypothetical protein